MYLGGVAWCSCFPAPSTLAWLGALPEACLPSEGGPYGETGRFCVEYPTFILQAVQPSTLAPCRGATTRCSFTLGVAVSFPRTVRIRLYHFRGVHMAIQGRSPQSDDAKDTAVEDGIAIPNFFLSLRAEPLGSNRGGRTRDCVDPRCGAVEDLSLMRARVDITDVWCATVHHLSFLSWDASEAGLRSANLTAICQTVLGGKGSTTALRADGRFCLFLVKKLCPGRFVAFLPFCFRSSPCVSLIFFSSLHLHGRLCFCLRKVLEGERVHAHAVPLRCQTRRP